MDRQYRSSCRSGTKLVNMDQDTSALELASRLLTSNSVRAQTMRPIGGACACGRLPWPKRTRKGTSSECFGRGTAALDDTGGEEKVLEVDGSIA